MENLKEVMMTEGLALEDLSEALEDITKKMVEQANQSGVDAQLELLNRLGVSKSKLVELYQAA